MTQNNALNEVLILAYEGIRARYSELQLPAFVEPAVIFELRLALGRCPPGTLEAEKAVRSWLNVWQTFD